MAKVLITEKVDPTGVKILEEKGYEVVYLQNALSEEELLEKIADVDAVFVRVAKITRKVMEAAPKLKVISKHGVGVDNIDVEAAKEKGIYVTSCPGANALSVAEHTMALILGLSKQICVTAEKYKVAGYESKNGLCFHEISGKTLGLVGMGRIGSMLASMCHFGFGMKVIGYDPFLKTAPEGVELTEDRDRVFKEADFVSLHLPLMPTTFHSVGSREFEMMKDTACILNCARGPIIDQEALMKALKEGTIAGAGLDVSEPEPAPKDDPLFAMPNVIMTPHSAAASEESMARVSKMGCENIVAVLEGREAEAKLVRA